MNKFVPVNSLEITLRTLLRDRQTPLWSFYTPLAAFPLWIIAAHHPELDGSDLVAPPGQNPEVCVFQFPKGEIIGIYTAHCRAEAAMKQWDISPAKWTAISAPGYSLLRFLHPMDKQLTINCGVKDGQYTLDPDLVEILLSRPEPPPLASQPQRKIKPPGGDPQRFLGPVREFLQRQPTVRAAWIFARSDAAPQRPGHHAYELLLLMRDPEDKSLLHQVELMAKSLTPVEMDWVTGVMTGDDNSLCNLAAQQVPFYQAPDFPARRAGV